MAALEAWTDANVIHPLVWCGEDEGAEQTFEDAEKVFQRVRVAIREKVRESYKNGLRSGAGAVRKEQQYAQAKTR